jgi:hypothetical protein
MEAADFPHASKKPKSTLGARVAELVQMKVLERVGPGTYRVHPHYGNPPTRRDGRADEPLSEGGPLSEASAKLSDMSHQPEENLS